jgi:hypothetical protein
MAGFEPKIAANERPQIYALDHAANGVGNIDLIKAVSEHAIHYLSAGPALGPTQPPVRSVPDVFPGEKSDQAVALTTNRFYSPHCA